MIDRYQNLLNHDKNFKADRPVLAQYNSSTQNLIERMRAELEELDHEVGNGHDNELIAQELADLGWFVMAFYEAIGKDMHDSMMEKAAYNIVRYPAVEMQEGIYHEVYPELKQRAKDQGIKEEFYR